MNSDLPPIRKLTTSETPSPTKPPSRKITANTTQTPPVDSEVILAEIVVTPTPAVQPKEPAHPTTIIVPGLFLIFAGLICAASIERESPVPKRRATRTNQTESFELGQTVGKSMSRGSLPASLAMIFGGIAMAFRKAKVLAIIGTLAAISPFHGPFLVCTPIGIWCIIAMCMSGANELFSPTTGKT